MLLTSRGNTITVIQAEYVKIDDLSDGCGQKFELLIVSPK